MSLPTYGKYKDSGERWLGVVPANWQVHRLKNLFEIRKRIVGEDGHQVLSITQRGIKIKDIESNDGQLSMDYSKYQIVQPGDFAMNHMDLLTGFVDISPHAGVTSPDYRVFAVRDGVACEPRYFLYLLQNGYRQRVFYAFGQGASEFGRWRFPTDQFNDFRFPCPSHDEQSAIAAFLDRETGKIDALIAEQEKLIALLAEKCQVTISHAVTKGLNPSAPMRDCGVAWLGNVPTHWGVAPLKSLSWLKGGSGFPDEEQGIQNQELGFYKVAALSQADQFDVLQPADNTVSRETAKRLGAFVFPPRTLVFAKVGAALLLGRVRFLPKQGCLDNNMMGIVVNGANNVDFVKYAMSLVRFDLIANPGTVPSLNASQIGNFQIAKPPFEEQTAIAEFLEKEIAMLGALQRQAGQVIALLRERRNALITAAVTGQIDVRGLVPQLETD